jgi:hypothetical protein
LYSFILNKGNGKLEEIFNIIDTSNNNSFDNCNRIKSRTNSKSNEKEINTFHKENESEYIFADYSKISTSNTFDLNIVSNYKNNLYNKVK